MKKYQAYNRSGKLLWQLFLNNLGILVVTSKGYVRAKIGGLHFFVDTKTGQLINPPKYDDVNAEPTHGFHDGFSVTKINGKFGMIDEYGKEVIPNHFAYVSKIHKNKYFGKKNNEWLLYKLDGSIVDHSYEDVEPFKYYTAVKKNGYWGLIDDDIVEVVSCEFDEITPWNNVYISLKKDKLYGILNSNFGLILPCNFESIDYFYHPEFIRVKKNGLFGIYDKSGTEILKCEFEEIQPIRLTNDDMGDDRKIVVQKNGKYGIIDLKGNIIVDFIHENILHFDGRTFVVVSKSSSNILNIDNQIVSKYKYQKIKNAMEGLRAVKRNGKWGYVDESGIEIIKCQFGEVTEFRNGHAFAKQDDKWNIIDNKGQISKKYDIDKFRYLESYSCDFPEFRGNYCAVVKNDKWGIIDSKYNLFVDFEFDDIHESYIGDYEVVLVWEGNSKKLYDLNKKLIFENKYDDIDLINKETIICCTKNVDVNEVPLMNIEVDSKFERDILANLYPRGYLNVHKLGHQFGDYLRVAVLALIENIGNEFSNRLYLIDIAYKNGKIISFIQGYAGGGQYHENFYVDNKCVDDFELPNDIILMIKEYTCSNNKELGAYQFDSLKNFKKISNQKNMYISYNVWIDEKMSYLPLFVNDRIRLMKMIKNTGITLTDPTEWE